MLETNFKTPYFPTQAYFCIPKDASLPSNSEAFSYDLSHENYILMVLLDQLLSSEQNQVVRSPSVSLIT